MMGQKSSLLLLGKAAFCQCRCQMGRLLSHALAILLVMLLSACGQSGVAITTGTITEGVSDDALHGLMTERISLLQRSIEVLLYEQNRTQSELDQTRRRQTAEIAAAAIELRDSVAQVAALEPRLRLSPASSATFISLARQLHNDSEALAELANGMRVGSLEDAVLQLQTSCDSCHSLYRND
jgi:hypothetical protein